MTISAARDTNMTFVRRYGDHTACTHCGRDLGMTYLLRDDRTGREAPYGRRCTARILGWATNRVEMEAVRVERMAELDRRRALITAERPDLAAAYKLRSYHPDASVRRDAEDLAMLFLNASSEDVWWGGRGWSPFSTWQEYVDSYAPAVKS